MYSLNLKKGFAGLKKGLKKGIVKGKSAIKQLSEGIDLWANPNKTNYKFSKPYFFKMNKVLRDNDPSFRGWRNWVIKRFAGMGFKSQYDILSVSGDELNAFSFDYGKVLKYDPIEQQIVRSNICNDWWRSGGQGCDSRFIDLKLEGSISFLLDYEKELVHTSFFIDYKKPLIPEIDPTVIDGLKAFTEEITESLGLALFTSYSKFEVKKLKQKVNRNISDERIREEMDDIIETLSDAEEDIDINQKEINKIIKEIKHIPDLEFQDGLLGILEEIQYLNPEARQKALEKIKVIISNYRV